MFLGTDCDANVARSPVSDLNGSMIGYAIPASSNSPALCQHYISRVAVQDHTSRGILKREADNVPAVAVKCIIFVDESL